MSTECESAALKNMKVFWNSECCKRILDEYEENLQTDVGQYITHGDRIEDPFDTWLEAQLAECRYLIITANPVESRTMKRLLYEEAQHRRIYKYWLATKRGILLSDEHDPQDPVQSGGGSKLFPRPDSKTEASRRSPRLLEVNLGKEVQYYFVTLGSVEEDGLGKQGRPIKIVYICPSNTSSFSGNGSHKAIAHALRRYPRGRYPFVASLGVAFGLRPSSSDDRSGAQQCLGDVLISQNIIAYDSKYKVREETEDRAKQSFKILFSECEKYSLEVGANRAFASLISGPDCHPFRTNIQEADDLDQTLRMGEIRCHMGALYSGGAVVSSREFKDSLLDAAFAGTGQRVDKLEPIGGEMEGVGIWYACLLEDDSFPCIVIKGICDWGEEKNGWSELLKRNGSTEFAEKAGKLLPEMLRQQFQYDDGEATAKLVSSLSAAFQQDNDRDAVLDAVTKEAVEQGLRGTPEGIRKKLDTACRNAEAGVNDQIKDAIQAYATEQAFKVFCHTIYDDVQLSLLPAKTPNESETRKENKRLQDEVKRLQSREPEMERTLIELQRSYEIQENQLKMKDEDLNRMKKLNAEHTHMINQLLQERNAMLQEIQELLERGREKE